MKTLIVSLLAVVVLTGCAGEMVESTPEPVAVTVSCNEKVYNPDGSSIYYASQDYTTLPEHIEVTATGYNVILDPSIREIDGTYRVTVQCATQEPDFGRFATPAYLAITFTSY